MSTAQDLSKKIDKSVKMIEKAYSALDQSILVGLSGGKDSLALYDLCKRVFGAQGTVPFHMDFIPNLRVIDEMLSNARERFGIKQILHYPDYSFFAYYKLGMYSWEGGDRSSLPDITRKKMYTYISKTTKISKMALGIKKNDNLRMKQQVEKNIMFGGTILPLYDWTTADVLTYLRLQKIEIPKPYYSGFRGVDLNDVSILYLNEHYPDDLEKIERFFPFVRAVVKQYEMYGLKLKIHRV